MRAVVLQPAYLPWIGYFAMIDMADVFVFYDDVQFSVQSWQQRNRIKCGDGTWMWLSVPIVRRFGQSINEVRINDATNWERKHWCSICQSYSRARYFDRYREDVEAIYRKEWEYLSHLDISLVKRVSELLNVKVPEFVRSCELKDIAGEKTDRLLAVLRSLGAKQYISGPAAKDYIEVDKFKSAGVRLYWHEFHHPRYPQLYGEFAPYLSVIDLLFNTGADAINYIREGQRDALVLDERTA